MVDNKIDKSKIVWDSEPKIDESKIVWDSEPLKKKEDTQFGGITSAKGTQNTSQYTSSSVLPSKNVSTPTNNIGQKIFDINQSVQDLVYKKEDKPFFEEAKEQVPQIPLKQEQLKKKETPKEESRLVKVWSPTEKAYIYKSKEVPSTISPESVVSSMTTQQLLDATPETVKFRTNKDKSQEQLSFEQQSDKNNNVQAFNREAKYYTTYSNEIGKRIEESEKVIKNKLGADFLSKLTKTSMSLNQTITTFNEYKKGKEKRANQLQSELTAIATKVKNGTLSKSDADYDFNLKREELEQIQNDLNQRVENIQTIQNQLELYKNIPEVKSYILLNEKLNKINEEARSLIFKDEYSEYRKTLDEASQKQFEKDTQKKEFLDKGFWGKASDILGALSNLSPVVLAEKAITGNKDKTYTGTAIKDESVRLMARTLNAITSYPKMSENTNPFGKAEKYDFFDKIFDATTEFSKEKELTNQNASDVQRDIKQKYVEVDGYRVLLDDKGNPTKVTDDRFFNVGGFTQSLIINKYKNNKEKYKDVKSDISVGTAVAKSVPTILDMGGLIALTTLTGGATAPLLGTEVAYGAATVASAAAQMYSGLYEGGIDAGLSPTEAGDFATVASLGVGSVSLINPMEMSIAKNLMTRKAGKEIAEKMTKSEIQLVLNGKLKATDLAIKYGKDYIKNTAGENLEEIVLEPLVQRGVEVLYNENAKKQGSGFEDLNKPFFNAKEVAETAIITSLSTLVFSPTETASSIPNEKILAVLKAIERPNEFMEALNDKLERGDITKERYDFEAQALEEVSNQYNSVKGDIRDKDKERLTELLAKKYNLKKEISKINDDVLNKRNKELLEEINKEIESIITQEEATQEEATQEEATQEEATQEEATQEVSTEEKEKAKIESTAKALEEKSAKNELANKLRSKAQELKEEDSFDNEITVKDAIGKEVEFSGVKGVLKTNDENEVYIESDNKEILIGKTVDGKFYNSTAIDNGIQVLKPTTKPIISLEEDNLTINGNDFKLESINQDNNGNVVSVTVQDENGNKRTFRDADMSMDIAIAKNNQEFNKRSDGIIENNEQYQEVKTDIDKSIKEEHGESASDVIDNMPEEVLDTFLAMDSGVVELAPNELQQMVLNTSMWIDKSRKDIENSNSTSKEKKEALSVLNKFENDLKKYYEKLEKARTGKTTSVTKSKKVESSTTNKRQIELKETINQGQELNNLKIVEDENENEFANSKLTGESEIEQEPNVKAIESEGENVTNLEQAEKVLGKINDLTDNALDIVSVPISEIKTNEEEYQGRNNAYSERSAENVAKHFDKNKFNPIVVYRHPNGNIYVLSGHSRLEGFKRRGEKNIPATFFEGTSEQAKDFALKSNKLGTLQTDLENAEYYRREREKGRSYNSLLSEAEQNEQKGTAKKIISLSYLNPKGKTIGALKSLEGSEGDSNSNLQVIGQKIGFIRSRNPHLTDAHENELFEYMIKDKDNIPTEREILDDNSKLNRNIASVKFDNNLPLNLSEIKIKSDARVEWEKERDDLKAKITELNKQVKPDIKTGWTGLKKEFIERIASLNNITDKEQSIQKAEEDFNNDVNKYNSIYNNQLSKKKIELKALQDKLAKHLLKESSVIGAEKSQPSLFGGTESTPIETKQKQEVINKLRDVAEDIDNQGSLFSSTLPNSLKSKALNKVADDIEAGLSVEQAIDKTVKELATKEQSQSLKDFINDVINDNYTSTQSNKESTTSVTPNVSIEQQIENFGIQDKGMVKAVSSVVQSLFNSLKKAGLILHDSVEDWLGIGKSGLVDEKALKQIIGEVGAENLPKIKANLDVARQMEAGGKTPKEIWLATGWERSKDKGKWKYDLPDFLQGVSDLFDLEDKRDGEIITNAGFVVSSELRKAYPQLDNIPVRINISRNNNPRGSFERVEINGKRKKDHDQINVYARDVAEAQSILIHEIQHAIQDIEGFARGGSPKQFEIDNVTKIVIDVFEQEGSKQKAKDRIERLMKANNSEYMDRILFVLDSVSEAQLNQIIKDSKLSKEEKYKRLAGEAEARNAQRRAGMTPEQRREQMISETEDIAEDSKIYIYGANEVQESRNLYVNYLEKFKDTPNNEKHNVLKEILDKTQIKYRLDVSHKNGSHYWIINGEYYRVSDHTKPKGSFGEEAYRDSLNIKDFRNYDDFYEMISKKYDLSDKSESELKYKLEAEKYIKKIDDDTFEQPDGSRFSSMESALNNMWRLKKKLPQIPTGSVSRDSNNILFQQDKAQEEIIKVNGKELTVRPINAEVVNGFYSPLEKVITDSKFEKLPAKQWIDKFAKGDEAKWTGLTEWLNQQQGSVSKADIQQYLKDNRIQVVEVVKSDRPFKEIKNKMFSLGNEWEEVYGGVEAKKSNKDGDRFNLRINGVEYQRDFSYPDAKSYIEANADVNPEKNRSKFSQYQLEGEKENYKEVLVTLPQSKQQKEINRLAEKYGVSNTYTALRESNATDSELEFVRSLKNDQFKSSHFDEPNILVHLRMNTRTDAQGNKVLFLEEVQSDWGQKGKKEGFANELKEGIDFEITKRTENILGKKKEIYGIKLKNGDKYGTYESRDEALKNLPNVKFATPSAPFVTDTNAWTKLGLKVALKEAVKQGADKIAWTTGEQQNDRYDLSKQVQSISYEKKSKEFSSKAQEKGQDLYSLYIETKESGYEQFDDLTISEVEGYVGKDIANKIQSNEGSKENLDTSKGNKKVNKLTGIDLKVGGKGMKGFYGSPTEGSLGIVGNVAKSLFKQDVGTIEIGLGRSNQTPTTVNKLGRKIDEKTAIEKIGEGTHVYTHDKGDIFRLYDANDVREALKSGFELYTRDNKDISTQHSIDITPELKASVEGGQPLFKDAEAQYRIESGKNIIEAIKDFDGSPRATVALTHEIMHPTVVEIINGAKEGNEVGKKHTNTIIEEFNKHIENKKKQLKLVEDEAENKLANSKLSEKDNIEQEPSIKAIERKAESNSETELNEVVKEIEKKINEAFDVERKKISEIKTDEHRFQNRDEINQEKVDSISKNWSDADQDPIHIWKDPKDGEYYVLSGHHRYYASKKRGLSDVKIIDRTKDFNEAEAIKFAKETANANRTMETPLERAKLLREKIDRGDSTEDIKSFLNNEGKGKIFIQNIASLNPKGKIMDMLRQFSKSDDKKIQKEIETIADWVGEARRTINGLTDAHEVEMVEFLLNKDASRRITTKADFIQKVRSVIKPLEPQEPLNISRFKYKTQGEASYDEAVESKKAEITERQQKINEINDRFTNPTNKDYIPTTSADYEVVRKIANDKIAKLELERKVLQKQLEDIYKQKGKYVGGETSGTLFSGKESKEFLDKVTEEQLIEWNDAFKNGTTTDGYRAVQEFIAEAWEQYHLKGKQGFSKPFQDILDKITEAFKAVYVAIKGTDLLTPELEKMFNDILDVKNKEFTKSEKETIVPKEEVKVEVKTEKETINTEPPIVSSKYNILGRSNEIQVGKKQSQTTERANESEYSDLIIESVVKNRKKATKLASDIVDEAMVENGGNLGKAIEDIKQSIELEWKENLDLDNANENFNYMVTTIFQELLDRAGMSGDKTLKDRVLSLYSKIGTLSGNTLGAMGQDMLGQKVSKLKEDVEMEQNDLLNMKTESGKTVSEEITSIMGELGKTVSDLINSTLDDVKSETTKAISQITSKNSKTGTTSSITGKKGIDRAKSALNQLKDLYKDDTLGFAFDAKKQAEKQLEIDKKTIALLGQIGKGLIEEGVATVKNVAEKIKEYLVNNSIPIKYDDYADKVKDILDDAHKQGALKNKNSERLSEAIINNDKVKNKKNKSVEEMMADALIYKYKSENKKDTPKKDKDIVKELTDRIKNNEVADKLWDEAFEQVKYKIESDSKLSDAEKLDKINKLEDYIAKAKGSPFRNSEVSKSVRDNFAGDKDKLAEKIKELSVSHFKETESSAEDFVERIVRETGLSAEDGKKLYEAIKKDIKDRVSNKAEQILKTKDTRIKDKEAGKQRPSKTELDRIVEDILRFGNLPEDKISEYSGLLQHYGIPVLTKDILNDLMDLANAHKTSSGAIQKVADVQFHAKLEEIMKRQGTSPLLKSKKFYDTVQDILIANILGNAELAVRSFTSTLINSRIARGVQSISDFATMATHLGLKDSFNFAFKNHSVGSTFRQKLAKSMDIILNGSDEYAKILYGRSNSSSVNTFKVWDKDYFKSLTPLGWTGYISTVLPIALLRTLLAGDMFSRESSFDAHLSREVKKNLIKEKGKDVKYGSEDFEKMFLERMMQTNEMQREIDEQLNEEIAIAESNGLSITESQKQERRKEIELDMIGDEVKLANQRAGEDILSGLPTYLGDELISKLSLVLDPKIVKELEGKTSSELNWENNKGQMALYHTLRIAGIGMKSVVPVINIPIRAFIEAMSYVPVIGFTRLLDKTALEVHKDYKNKYVHDSDFLVKNITKQILGGIVAGVTVSQAFKSKKDDEGNDVLKLNDNFIVWGEYDRDLANNYSNFRPNSIYVNGEFISMRDNILLMPFYFIGRLSNKIAKREIMRNKLGDKYKEDKEYLELLEDTRSRSKLISSALSGMGSYFVDGRYAQGMKRLMDAVQGDKDYERKKALYELSSGMFRVTPLQASAYTQLIDWFSAQEHSRKSDGSIWRNFTNYIVQNSLFNKLSNQPNKYDILGNVRYKDVDLTPVVYTSYTSYLMNWKDMSEEKRNVYDFALKNGLDLGSSKVESYFDYKVKKALNNTNSKKFLKDIYNEINGKVSDSNFEEALTNQMKNEVKIEYGKYMVDFVKNNKNNKNIEGMQKQIYNKLNMIKRSVEDKYRLNSIPKSTSSSTIKSF